MLDIPLRRRKPTTWFVNSMSDLFHENLSFEDIDKILTVMVAADQHVYQILTKRADRMLEYFGSGRHDGGNGPDRAAYHLDGKIWLGVSVENQETKWRIDRLRETPAALRFLSIEPLLEDIGTFDLSGISWVIVGGESGPGARPMHPDWARSVRDQCQAAGVAFFFKQWGEWSPFTNYVASPESFGEMRRVGKKAAGAVLDGREWREMPVPGQPRTV